MLWSEDCDEILDLSGTSNGILQTLPSTGSAARQSAAVHASCTYHQAGSSLRLASGRTSLRAGHACWSPRSSLIRASVFPGHNVDLHDTGQLHERTLRQRIFQQSSGVPACTRSDAHSGPQGKNSNPSRLSTHARSATNLVTSNIHVLTSERF